MRTQSYRFDRVFGPPPRPGTLEDASPEEVSRLVEIAAQARVDNAVAEARQSAWEEGHAAGHEQARAELQAQLETAEARAVGRLLEEIDGLAAQLPLLRGEIERQAVDAVIGLVARIAPELMAAAGDARIEVLLREALTRHGDDGVLQVRVGPPNAAAAEAAISTAGTPGQVEIEIDPALVCGAVEVRWQGGGVSYDPHDVLTALNEVFARAGSPATIDNA